PTEVYPSIEETSNIRLRLLSAAPQVKRFSRHFIGSAGMDVVVRRFVCHHSDRRRAPATGSSRIIPSASGRSFATRHKKLAHCPLRANSLISAFGRRDGPTCARPGGHLGYSLPHYDVYFCG